MRSSIPVHGNISGRSHRRDGAHVIYARALTISCPMKLIEFDGLDTLMSGTIAIKWAILTFLYKFQQNSTSKILICQWYACAIDIKQQVSINLKIRKKVGLYHKIDMWYVFNRIIILSISGNLIIKAITMMNEWMYEPGMRII